VQVHGIVKGFDVLEHTQSNLFQGNGLFQSWVKRIFDSRQKTAEMMGHRRLVPLGFKKASALNHRRGPVDIQLHNT